MADIPWPAQTKACARQDFRRGTEFGSFSLVGLWKTIGQMVIPSAESPHETRESGARYQPLDAYCAHADRLRSRDLSRPTHG